jgi:hypothetical protein
MARFAAVALCVLMSGALVITPQAQPDPRIEARWDSLAPGLELGFFKGPWPSPVGDTTITVLRVDPLFWRPRFLCISQTGGSNALTAKDWCERYDMVAATNAGMFATDYSTHVGFMRSTDHVNSDAVNQYLSALAFEPVVASLPRARIFDLDVIKIDAVMRDYANVAQNLRLIKRPRVNRWSAQDKRWSEAALGEDSSGRLLFIFARSPFSMHDLNNILVSLPIDLVCAQHLEGGPEAQLYIRLGQAEHEFVGSFETDFRSNDSNNHAWPIPNALAIEPRR